MQEQEPSDAGNQREDLEKERPWIQGAVVSHNRAWLLEPLRLQDLALSHDLGQSICPLVPHLPHCKMGIRIASAPKVCSEGSGLYWGKVQRRFLASHQ